tara:strand:- start:36 stop:413 length:378 start_codon:yes stop_codon:yes gene_type:complete
VYINTQDGTEAVCKKGKNMKNEILKLDEPRVSQFLIEAIENLGANPSLSVADIPPFDSDNNTNALSNVISQMEKFANSDISEESYLKYAGASKDETQKLWAFAGRLLLLFHPATTNNKEVNNASN